MLEVENVTLIYDIQMNASCKPCSFIFLDVKMSRFEQIMFGFL